MATTYNVVVTVSQHSIDTSEGENTAYLVEVAPERLLLDGDDHNTIIWTMGPASIARFTSAGDIHFRTQQGRDRFGVVYTGGALTATINGDETNETIYTYYLTVHIGQDPVMVSIRLDPEVDNPPPPPRP